MSNRKAVILKQDEVFAEARGSAAVPDGENANVAIKLSDLCERIGADYDDARYALACGTAKRPRRWRLKCQWD